MREQIFNLFTSSKDLTLTQIILNIAVAAVIGFFIFLSYAISHRGTIYSKKFNASLVIMTVLTATVMTVIGNNIALSLGMVGRFLSYVSVLPLRIPEIQFTFSGQSSSVSAVV